MMTLIRNTLQRSVLGFAVGVAALSTATAAEAKTVPKAAKPYPLATCAVSGEKLGEMGEPYVLVEDGQEVQLCCKSCLKDFNKGKAKIMAKVKEASAKVKPYPLTTCLVSGEKLEDAYVFVHEGREIKLCCKSCAKDFKKEPAKYVKRLEAAAKPAAR